MKHVILVLLLIPLALYSKNTKKAKRAPNTTTVSAGTSAVYCAISNSFSNAVAKLNRELNDSQRNVGVVRGNGQESLNFAPGSFLVSAPSFHVERSNYIHACVTLTAH
ncbi:MAG: hypothetical protein ACPGJV_08085 [Bacteriovoracaceae bacterium]